MVKKKKKKKNFEWVKRTLDGAREKWELHSEVSLGILSKAEAKKYPHLRKRMRWVITEIRKNV